MSSVDADALADAVRHIREMAMRQVMVVVNRMRPDGFEADDVYATAHRRGHLQARMQIYDEIERMIARDAAPVAVGEYEPEGDAAEPVEDD